MKYFIIFLLLSCSTPEKVEYRKQKREESKKIPDPPDWDIWKYCKK